MTRMTNRNLREISRRVLANIPDNDEEAHPHEYAALQSRVTLDVIAESHGMTAEEFTQKFDMAEFSRGVRAKADDAVDVAVDVVAAAKKGPQ